MKDYPHFSASELACHCGCGTGEMDDQFMLNMIVPAREKCGFAWNVDSGYRCPKHDFEVKGDGNHPSGMAIDPRFQTLEEVFQAVFWAMIFGVKRIGISIEGKWCHFDNYLEHPYPTIWFYEPHLAMGKEMRP